MLQPVAFALPVAAIPDLSERNTILKFLGLRPLAWFIGLTQRAAKSSLSRTFGR